jgi:hypothetical protein
MILSLVEAVDGGATLYEKVRKLETVSVGLAANGNSGEVNPTKPKCELPLRTKLGHTNLFPSFSITLE